MKALMMVLARDGLDQTEFDKFRSLVPGCECWVISARSPPNSYTFTFPVYPSLPVPVRVALSINAFLKWRKPDHDWLLKVDSDMDIPKNYFADLDKKQGVYGCGSVMAISSSFFSKYFESQYPVSYCDDGMIGAAAEALGLYEYREVEGTWHKYKGRQFLIGIEHYKWGSPFWLSIAHMRKGVIRDNLGEFVGWLFAFFTRAKKYWFAPAYRKVITKRFFSSDEKHVKSSLEESE